VNRTAAIALKRVAAMKRRSDIKGVAQVVEDAQMLRAGKRVAARRVQNARDGWRGGILTHMNTTPPRSFSLIVIGDEILSGKRQDKHLAKMIELLNARGLVLAAAEYVGDDRARIEAALRAAFVRSRERGEIVFSTGGIGATPDDHTRRCAAAALGVPLALHPEAKAFILERMQDVAREQGVSYDPDREDNVHRLNMGVFPTGASIIPNPYNKIAGFSVGDVHFVPGFPVMAWPMMAWVLDTKYAHLFRHDAWIEKSVIVMGAMEATLTPLMEAIERDHSGVKVFSLPSVDHPQYGRHIDLGVKGTPDAVTPAYAQLRAGLAALGATVGPELTRP
jgi:molybdopterin-biosynthesis enzyme MoeA-like protein